MDFFQQLRNILFTPCLHKAFLFFGAPSLSPAAHFFSHNLLMSPSATQTENDPQIEHLQRFGADMVFTSDDMLQRSLVSGPRPPLSSRPESGSLVHAGGPGLRSNYHK